VSDTVTVELSANGYFTASRASHAVAKAVCKRCLSPAWSEL
jgi:hypothetical protein